MVLPNQLTVLRIILTPFFVFFFLSDTLYFREIALLIFLVAALTDWYDGWLARKFNYITNWGKFWDPMADKILTAGAFFSFVYLGVLSFWLSLIILLRDFLVTTFRGLADKRGLSFPTSRYAKWKTFIQMAFLYYMLVMYVAQKHGDWGVRYKEFFQWALHPAIVAGVLWFIAVITVHSGALYLYDNRIHLKKILGINE
jgi:CDP-diacylglycerol--glycerol-3-phosphate 3-phosphatidyltransferase